MKTTLTVEAATAANFFKSLRGPGNRPSTCHSWSVTAWPGAKEISGHHPKMGRKQFQSSKSLLQYFGEMPNGGLYSWYIRSLLRSQFLPPSSQKSSPQAEAFLIRLPNFPFSLLFLHRLLESSSFPGVSAAILTPAPPALCAFSRRSSRQPGEGGVIFTPDDKLVTCPGSRRAWWWWHWNVDWSDPKPGVFL